MNHDDRGGNLGEAADTLRAAMGPIDAVVVNVGIWNVSAPGPFDSLAESELVNWHFWPGGNLNFKSNESLLQVS